MILKVKAVRENELEPGHSTPHPHCPSYGAVSSQRGKRTCTHTHQPHHGLWGHGGYQIPQPGRSPHTM